MIPINFGESNDPAPATPQDSLSDPEQSRGIVVMLSGDLMFIPKVKSAAVRTGYEFSAGGKLPTDPEKLAKIRFVILDLKTLSRLTDSIVDQCKEQCPDAKLIAYGPHVQVGKLKAAREAGIGTVLTNSQIDAGLASFLERS